MRVQVLHDDDGHHHHHDDDDGRKKDLLQESRVFRCVCSTQNDSLRSAALRAASQRHPPPTRQELLEHFCLPHVAMKTGGALACVALALLAAVARADLTVGESMCLAACQADVMTHQVNECTKWRDRLPRPDLFSLCQDGYDLGAYSADWLASMREREREREC